MRFSEEQLKELEENINRNSPLKVEVSNTKGAESAVKPKPALRGMNQTEKRYADNFLIPMLLAGEIDNWMFEGLSFKLAKGARYKPDFNVWYPDGHIENIEIKGGGPIREASILRVKVARDMHPWTIFTVMQWKNGEWTEKIKP